MELQRGDLKVRVDDEGIVVGFPHEGVVLSPDELRWLAQVAAPAVLCEFDPLPTVRR